jgi:hypothetical protein
MVCVYNEVSKAIQADGLSSAMALMDPDLPDGIHHWRDGRLVEKKGARLALKGTDILAGRYAELIALLRFGWSCWRRRLIAGT